MTRFPPLRIPANVFSLIGRSIIKCRGTPGFIALSSPFCRRARRRSCSERTAGNKKQRPLTKFHERALLRETEKGAAAPSKLPSRRGSLVPQNKIPLDEDRSTSNGILPVWKRLLFDLDQPFLQLLFEGSQLCFSLLPFFMPLLLNFQRFFQG